MQTPTVAMILALAIAGCRSGTKHEATPEPQPGTASADDTPLAKTALPPPAGPPAAAIASNNHRDWIDRCHGDARDPETWDPGDLDAARTRADAAIAGIAPEPPPPPTGEDVSSEAAAREIIALVARGDLAGATAAVHALPPMWGVRVDPRDPTEPRWSGSPAMATCVAIAPAAAPQGADARALVTEAEARTQGVTDDWRRNREWRAIATAWARLGDPERALTAAARMPGSERADTIANLVLDLGPDVPADRFARLVVAAGRALTTDPGTPLVLPEPGQTAPRQETLDVVKSATAGDVGAAIAVAEIGRHDLDGARAEMSAIPENVFVRWTAAGALACGLELAHRPAEPALHPTSAMVLDRYLEGLVLAGCGERARAEAKDKGEMNARKLIQLAIENGAPAVAAEVFTDHRAQWQGAQQADELCAVLGGLGGAGHAKEAAALVLAEPSLVYPLVEHEVATCGLRVVPALVAAGDTDGARKLRDAMARRAAAT